MMCSAAEAFSREVTRVEHVVNQSKASKVKKHGIDTALFSRFSFKANAFEWLITVPNFGVEFDLLGGEYNRYTLTLQAKYNWNTFHKHAPATVFNMFEVRPEFRYYFRYKAVPSSRYTFTRKIIGDDVYLDGQHRSFEEWFLERKSLTLVNQRYESAKREVAKVREKLADLQKNYDKFYNEQTGFPNTYRNFKKEYQDFLEEYEAYMKESTDSLAALSARLDSLSSGKSVLEFMAEYDDFQEQYAEFKAVYDEFVGIQNDFNAELREFSTEYSQMGKTEKRANQERLAQYKERQKELREQRQGYEAWKEDMDAQKRDYEDKKTELEETKIEIRRSMDELKREQRRYELKKKSYEEDNRDKEARKAFIDSQKKEFDAEKARLEKELKMLEEELAAANSAKAAFEALDEKGKEDFEIRRNKKLDLAQYVGAYVSYGTYSFKLSPKGIQGTVAGFGATYGVVFPLYDYNKTNDGKFSHGALDLELGFSVGLQVCDRQVFTHNPNGNYYTKLQTGTKGWHFTPFPVISEMRVAFVWRPFSIKDKYRKTNPMVEKTVLERNDMLTAYNTSMNYFKSSFKPSSEKGYVALEMKDSLKVYLDTLDSERFRVIEKSTLDKPHKKKLVREARAKRREIEAEFNKEYASDLRTDRGRRAADLKVAKKEEADSVRAAKAQQRDSLKAVRDSLKVAKDSAAAQGRAEKPVKEKPIKEKPVKEKPVKNKKDDVPVEVIGKEEDLE